MIHNAIRESRSDDKINVTLERPRKDEDFYSQVEKLEAVSAHPPDGLIVVAIDDRPDIRRVLHAISRRGTTIVTVDRDVDLESEADFDSRRMSSSIVADCLKGGELAA